MEVKKGSKVKVHYTGTLDDGTVFDSSEGKDPLEFSAGEGKVIKGFDEGIIGMNEGEEKEIKIKAADAYGERNDQMIQAVPRDKIPANVEIKEGQMLMMKTQQGQQFPVRVDKVEKDVIKLDFNHPLAGKNLNFKVKIEKVE